MDIGSAKIMPEQMQGIKHYLVDEFMPHEAFNVVKFQQYARKYMQEIYGHGKIPILVGGTGFYIQAVLYDIDFTENEENTPLRNELEQFAQKKGANALHERLVQLDPESAADIHPNNIKRVIRAIEFYELTGQRISEHNAQQHQKESPYNYAYFVLNDDRKFLYERIEQRVDKMLTAGLIDEVKHLKEMGYTRDMVSMQGLGYKEILDALDGVCTMEEAIDTVKKNTRHFAKRQLTWFRRERNVEWIEKPEYGSDENAILAHILHILQRKEIIQ